MQVAERTTELSTALARIRSELEERKRAEEQLDFRTLKIEHPSTQNSESGGVIAARRQHATDLTSRRVRQVSSEPLVRQ